eukprot:12910618-Prorocentrum_lima.AAC.1
MPIPFTAPLAFTPNPNAVAASTWPGATPPAHSPSSDQSSMTFDVFMREPSVSQLPATELIQAMPRMNMGAP